MQSALYQSGSKKSIQEAGNWQNTFHGRYQTCPEVVAIPVVFVQKKMVHSASVPIIANCTQQKSEIYIVKRIWVIISTRYTTLRYFRLWTQTADTCKLKLVERISTRDSKVSPWHFLHACSFHWKRPWDVSTSDACLIYQSQVVVCPCLFKRRHNISSNSRKTYWACLTSSHVITRRLIEMKPEDMWVFPNCTDYLGHVIRPERLERWMRTIDTICVLQHPTTVI